MIQQIATYFSEHGAEWLQMVVDHLAISGMAVAAAIAIAVPLGIACSGRTWSERIVTGGAGVLRVIPSLAVLIICVPYLGVGTIPAVVALTVLAIPPILINTTVAIRGVPDDIIEAATAMGMGPLRLWLTIKAPLAFPLAFSGVRTAVSEVIASATLAAYIGAGGLGILIHTALENGDIDLYPEYTGTGLISVLKMDPMTDPEEVYETVKEAYAEKFDLAWLNKSDAADGQGLVIRTEAAEKYDIKTITDLQRHAAELCFASQGQFDERADGLPALETAYGPFDWKGSAIYDEGLKYEVLRNDEADVTPAYTTEAQLTDNAFTLLEDDKHVWPPYNVAPVVRAEVLKAEPGIAEALNRVSAALTTEELTRLNARVDIDKEEYEDVAKNYYDSIS